MHDCASILDNIAKKTSCSHCFSHGTYISIHSFFHVFLRSYSAYNYVVTRMRKCTCHHVLVIRMASCLVARRIQCSVARLVVTP